MLFCKITPGLLDLLRLVICVRVPVTGRHGHLDIYHFDDT